MTPDEQIIALGTLDGFTDIHGGDTGAYWRGTKDGRCEPLPDYDSLDVMHRMTVSELKKHMCFADFVEHLASVMKVPSASIALIIATTAQRREALLRTLALWKTPQ